VALETENLSQTGSCTRKAAEQVFKPDPKAALRKLQDYERVVAAKSFKLQEELVGPVEGRIQQELFSRKVQ
jgi:hypothetical protein